MQRRDKFQNFGQNNLRQNTVYASNLFTTASSLIMNKKRCKAQENKEEEKKRE